MKLDNFSGYVIYDNELYVFNFNNYNIQLMPGDSMRLITCKIDFLEKQINLKNDDGFIEDIIIFGTCFDYGNVAFCISNYPNGNMSFKVKWVCLYNNDFDKLVIDSIKFTSQEIDYIYRPMNYIEDDFDSEDRKKIYINTNGKNDIGSFSYKNNKIDLVGEMTWRRNYRTNDILKIWSNLIMKFNSSISDLNEIFELIVLQKKCYRCINI